VYSFYEFARIERFQAFCAASTVEPDAVDAAQRRGAAGLPAHERSLAGELGVDPSPQLSALHVALLPGELGRRPRHAH
jgi:hypothetical protein